ncbi:MAG: hypothetical protein KGQ93_15145 [Cyanobacteria bacterium REEB459]|nr:hypothetical protein [Cyanobacteria bacterium REEB459]
MKAFLIDQPVTEVLEGLRPVIVVKGKQHENRFNSQFAILETDGGRLLFGSGEATFSSLDLIRNEFTPANPQTIYKPQQFMGCHGLYLRVCVVGDLIIDESIIC